MKKAVSLVLAVIMLSALLLTGCTTLVGDDKGAIIDMYITTEVYNFDPQVSITDTAMLKVFSLCYEGLTRLDKNGKWQNALMKNYSVDKDNEEEFSILIYLKNSYWTDGRTVQAADFAYSWKRLLDANAKNEAASLLYDVKNALDIKLGDASIDDLGVAAVDTYTLKVTFERKVDLNRFFENCSSVALSPLREDVISRYGDELWAKKGTYIITNGPFTPKTIDYPNLLRLERSPYYYLDRNKNENLDKYVIPYRLLTNYFRGDLNAQLDAFNEGSIFYLGELPLDKRAELKGDAVISDMMATHTYVINTKNELLSDPRVREALSLAIDREAAAEILTFAKPATGYIPEKVFNTGRGTSFRNANGDVLGTTQDLAKAKSLLAEAGISGGSFTLTVRNTEADTALAKYVTGEWEKLGFDVTVNKIRAGRNETETDLTDDSFELLYDSGDFDIIAIDMTMLSPDPFSALSQFAVRYSGNGVDMYSENYDLYPNISGYASEEYDALIDAAHNSASESERAEKLAEAEKLLLKDMPVIPIVFLQDAYLISGELSGITEDYYGVENFNRVQLKDYMTYKAATEEAK
ncbi:MAG: peptide ABC transporter substrate-binding protein [Clostridia bacterium]|nr:peptide ABC transporter substrate-binding protein [Clostridia bacterium]